MYLKKYYIYFYFLIVHFPTNNALGGLIFSLLVCYIHDEGTMSQIFRNSFSFYARKKR